jgi:membrane associated rhomboid family serine protease
MKTEAKPSWRKPAGVFMMIGIIVVLCVVIGSISHWLLALPVIAQMLIYAVLGVIWILPLRPLLLWMETGKWRV